MLFYESIPLLVNIHLLMMMQYDVIGAKYSNTITTGHPCRTYIGAPSEYFPYSDTTNQTCILIIVITNQHHVLSTTAQPQPHHAPHTFHVPGQSHCARTSLEVMSRGHHKDLQGFTSASFGTIRNTSLLIICSF